MASKPFKELLATQKKNQSKEVEAIAEATQDYAIQIQRDKGLGANYIKENKIRNAAVSVVQNFTGELDGIADNDYEYIKELVVKYNGVLKELKGSVDKGRFTDKEGTYIADIIQPVLSELGSLTGPLLRARLAFKEFTKQFKPIKLADRFLGDIPLIGKMIKKKIERKETAEKEVRGAERRASQEKARKARATIEDQVAGFSEPDMPAEDLTEQQTPSTKPTQRAIKKQVSASAAEENAKEAAEKSEEIKSIFEMIAESTYETNENVKKLVDGEKDDQKTKGGILSSLLPLAALTTLGATLGASFGAGLKLLGSTLLSPLKAIKGLLPGAKPPVRTPAKTPPKGSPKTAAVKTGDKPKAEKPKAKKSLVKQNLAKGKNIAKKVGKGALRVAGRAFLPLAAVMGIFDAATGVAQAGELLGKEDDELTFRDKASSGFAGFLSGLTFGLVDKKKTANFLAGKKKSKGVDNLDEGTYGIGEEPKMPDDSEAQFGELKSEEEIQMDEASEKIEKLKGRRKLNAIKRFKRKFGTSYDEYKKGVISKQAQNFEPISAVKGKEIESAQFDNDMMKRMNNNAPVNNNVVAPNNVVNNNNSTNVLPKMENVNTHRTIMSVNDDAVF